MSDAIEAEPHMRVVLEDVAHPEPFDAVPLELEHLWDALPPVAPSTSRASRAGRARDTRLAGRQRWILVRW